MTGQQYTIGVCGAITVSEHSPRWRYTTRLQQGGKIASQHSSDAVMMSCLHSYCELASCLGLYTATTMSPLISVYLKWVAKNFHRMKLLYLMCSISPAQIWVARYVYSALCGFLCTHFGAGTRTPPGVSFLSPIAVLIPGQSWWQNDVN